MGEGYNRKLTTSATIATAYNNSANTENIDSHRLINAYLAAMVNPLAERRLQQLMVIENTGREPSLAFRHLFLHGSLHELFNLIETERFGHVGKSAQREQRCAVLFAAFAGD
jgi:hypothetical protein